MAKPIASNWTSNSDRGVSTGIPAHEKPIFNAYCETTSATQNTINNPMYQGNAERPDTHSAGSSGSGIAQ